MKDIKGFEGFYAATEDGRVWSYRRKKFINATINNTGYYTVSLCVNSTRKTFLLHRLMAETFLNNPENYPIVNHKDENKYNNCIDNLEWCSYSYNNSYGKAAEDRKEKKSKKVYCIELDKTFDSQKEAEKELDIKHISDHLSGKQKTCGGYTFRRVG